MAARNSLLLRRSVTILPSISTRNVSLSSVRYSSDQSSETGSSGPKSWFDRIKRVFTGDKSPSDTGDKFPSDTSVFKSSATDAISKSVAEGFTIEKFADQLKAARRLGSIAQFGKGLPRGGEKSVVQSLQAQENILRALADYGPHGPQQLGTQQKAEVSSKCGCTPLDVEQVFSKYGWAKEAYECVKKLEAEGKPVPKTFHEIETMMGGRWKPDVSRNLGQSSEVSRNQACPCGSGKKYKRCCGSSGAVST